MPEATLDATRRHRIRRLANDLRRWLALGALQSPNGAFCAWLDISNGERAFMYPEITGYALTWLAGREDLTDRELDAGFRAADWLVDRFVSGDRSARADWDEGAVYAFDLGMISAGLQSFGELVESRRYTDQGRALARELGAYVRSGRGLEAIAPDGPTTQRPGPWSTSGQPHLVKCAQSLLLADEAQAAERLARATMNLQSADGRFWTQPAHDKVMLHPHLYTVEGLWMWGVACECDEAIERARAAVSWSWEHQLATGGLPRYVSRTGVGPEQFDVTSQAIRAALMLDVKPAGLDDAILRLADVAVATDTGAALVYQPNGVHLNAWVTMFGAQALALASGDRDAQLDWALLV